MREPAAVLAAAAAAGSRPAASPAEPLPRRQPDRRRATSRRSGRRLPGWKPGAVDRRAGAGAGTRGSRRARSSPSGGSAARRCRGPSTASSPGSPAVSTSVARGWDWLAGQDRRAARPVGDPRRARRSWPPSSLGSRLARRRVEVEVRGVGRAQRAERGSGRARAARRRGRAARRSRGRAAPALPRRAAAARPGAGCFRCGLAATRRGAARRCGTRASTGSPGLRRGRLRPPLPRPRGRRGRAHRVAARARGGAAVSRRWRIALGIVALLVALNLALRFLGTLTGGTPGGPRSSSYATRARRATRPMPSCSAAPGIRSRRCGRLPHQAPPEPGERRSFLLDPPCGRDAGSRRRSGRFVGGGGRLVAAGAVAWRPRASSARGGRCSRRVHGRRRPRRTGSTIARRGGATVWRDEELVRRRGGRPRHGRAPRRRLAAAERLLGTADNARVRARARRRRATGRSSSSRATTATAATGTGLSALPARLEAAALRPRSRGARVHGRARPAPRPARAGGPRARRRRGASTSTRSPGSSPAASAATRRVGPVRREARDALLAPGLARRRTRDRRRRSARRRAARPGGRGGRGAAATGPARDADVLATRPAPPARIRQESR